MFERAFDQISIILKCRSILFSLFKEKLIIVSLAIIESSMREFSEAEFNKGVNVASQFFSNLKLFPP